MAEENKLNTFLQSNKVAAILKSTFEAAVVETCRSFAATNERVGDEQVIPVKVPVVKSEDEKKADKAEKERFASLTPEAKEAEKAAKKAAADAAKKAQKAAEETEEKNKVKTPPKKYYNSAPTVLNPSCYTPADYANKKHANGRHMYVQCSKQVVNALANLFADFITSVNTKVSGMESVKTPTDIQNRILDTLKENPDSVIEFILKVSIFNRDPKFVGLEDNKKVFCESVEKEIRQNLNFGNNNTMVCEYLVKRFLDFMFEVASYVAPSVFYQPQGSKYSIPIDSLSIAMRLWSLQVPLVDNQVLTVIIPDVDSDEADNEATPPPPVGNAPVVAAAVIKQTKAAVPAPTPAPVAAAPVPSVPVAVNGATAPPAPARRATKK